jgi:hypothetical protein
MLKWTAQFADHRYGQTLPSAVQGRLSEQQLIQVKEVAHYFLLDTLAARRD